MAGLKLFDFGTELNRARAHGNGTARKIDFKCSECGKHRASGNHKRCSKQKQKQRLKL